MSDLIENFLQSLYTDNRADAKEWRGANIPYGDDSNRPNLIRKCFTLESDRMKINCLRKLRDQVAMNPFYQARLDRFVDAITQTWEPTDKPGTIPGNEFKTGYVGDDLTEDTIKQKISESYIEELFQKKKPKQLCAEAKAELTRYIQKLKDEKIALAKCKQNSKYCPENDRAVLLSKVGITGAEKKIKKYCK